MPDNPISQTEWTLVQRYLIGPVTPAETDVAQAVVQRESRLQALVDVLQTTAPVTDSPTIDLGSLKRRIDATRMAAPPSAGWPRRSKGQPLPRGILYTLAGTILAVLMLVTDWHIGDSRHAPFMSTPTSTYTTGNGERANITLPDGNTVSLDVASRLEVPADYLAGDHTLRLSGEALFTVQHHAENPVTVLAGQTTTRVLGTSFLVRHYATDSTTTVAVRDGKVAVGTAIAVSNQWIQIQRNGTTLVRPATPTQFSFATGTLTLDDQNLLEAIPELDRWYDADIRLGDRALAQKDVGGAFAAGSLADLTELLQYTLNVQVVRKGRVLTLYPKR